MSNNLTVSLSPHIHCGDTISRRMWDVVIALVPALVVAVVIFGVPAAMTVGISLAACLLTEWLIDRFLLHRPSTIGNGSAVITGLLLAFNLPAALPWWMTVIGGVVAIGIGKMSFGGLGTNIWNPALVGRVFLLLSFPAAMTTWSSDVASGMAVVTSASTADATTGATLLTYLNGHYHTLEEVNLYDLALGRMNGSLGEVGSLAILLGLIYMLCRKVISWHIPVAVIVSAAIMSWMLGGNPLLDILAGGLLLGAVFMATDYVTSPMTHGGQLVYGVMIGIITILIRRFGAYPEGMSFAILLMNSFTPLINSYFRPRRFAERRGR